MVKGRENAAKREVETTISLAWQIAARSAEAMNGKLKPFDRYMPRGSRKAQTPDQMLAVLMAMQDRGAPMRVKKLN